MLLTAVTLIAGFGSLSAAPLTFDLRSGSSTPYTVTGGGVGNVFTFVSNGVSMTLTSWGITGDHYTEFRAGTTGRWAEGVGVCDALEGSSCGSPEHQVDNDGAVDFLLLQFSTPVFPQSIIIQPYGYYDSDVTYFLGNTSSSLNLTGLTVSDLPGVGFGTAKYSPGNVDNDPRTVNITSNTPVNSILFGARLSSGGDRYDDYFKVQVVNAAPVPEPATLGLVGAALAAVGIFRKRPASTKSHE